MQNSEMASYSNFTKNKRPYSRSFNNNDGVRISIRPCNSTKKPIVLLSVSIVLGLMLIVLLSLFSQFLVLQTVVPT